MSQAPIRVVNELIAAGDPAGSARIDRAVDQRGADEIDYEPGARVEPGGAR